MKKLFSLLLVLVLAVGIIASCGPKVNEDLEAAGEYIDALYKNEATNTTVDYDVVANVVYNGKTYPITWTVDVTAGVTIADSAAEGFKTVKVERGDADIAYKLTATITDGEDTVTKTYDRVVPATVPQSAIVDEAYRLEVGATMDGTQTLTGKIITIDTPYDAGYKNVTVTIVVDNLTDKPIMCYRLKGDQAATLKVGDTITVEGTITNYKGTIEFNAGCLIKAYTAWAPNEAEKVAFEKNALTYAETIYADGSYDLAATGATYTDVTITWAADPATAIAEGKLAVTQTAAEQTVTLTATLTCGTATDTKTIVVKIAPKDNRVAQLATSVDTTKTYVLAINQLKLGKLLFTTGEMSSYYAATAEAKELGAAVNVELVSGTTDKYYLKITVVEAVKYVNMVTSTSGDNTYVNIKFEDTAATQYTFNTTYNTLVANVNNGDYFFAIQKDKTFETFGPRTVNADDYPAQLFELVDPNATPAADKIANEKSKLTISTDITTAEVTVPVVGADYPDVTITWASSDPAVVVNGDKLNVTLPAAAGFKKVTITATIAREGATSETKEFTVTLWKLPTTEAEMVSVLYSLEKGMTVPGKYTLTGRVVSFDNNGAYSSQYHNVSIWVMVGNDAEHPVLVYRLKDVDNNDASIKLIKVGDTITVENGTLTDYNTKKEITGATIKSYTAWVPTEAEKVGIEHVALNVNTNIAVNTTLALPAVGATYTDVAITWTADGAPVSGNYEIALGDTAREIALVANVSLGNTTLTKTFTLTVAAKPAEGPSRVAAPVIGQTYKLAIAQGNLGKFLYITGASINTHYLATTEAAAEAANVTLEAVDGVDGAFRLTFTDDSNAKKYIEVWLSGNYANIRLVDTAPETYYTVNETNGAIYTTISEKDYYLGAYNDYSRVGGSDTKYITGDKAANIGVTQFPLYFYESKVLTEISAEDKVATEKNLLNITYPDAIVSETEINLVTNTVLFEDVTVTWAATGATIVDNKVTITPAATEQTVTLTATIAATGATSVTKTWTITVPAADNRVPVTTTAPVAGTAYKFVAVNNNVEYYMTSSLSSQQFLVTTVKNEAVDFYVEVNGEGYNIYYMDGTNKKYIEYAGSGTKFNVVDSAPSTTWSYNSENERWEWGTTGRYFGLANSLEKVAPYASTGSYPAFAFATLEEPAAQ